MNVNHREVDKLYKDLKIENCNAPRTTINCGNMDRKLNSNFSAVIENNGHMSLSNSAGSLKS